MARSRWDKEAMITALERAADEFDPLFEPIWAHGETRALVGYWLEEFMPVVSGILDESMRLIDTNPSAGLVWSVQALEVFAKEGVCRPALFYRLGWDSETAEDIFKDLLGRNGGEPAARLVSRLLDFRLEEIRDERGKPIWETLVKKDSGGIDLRNAVVHKGFEIQLDESKRVHAAVRTFISFVDSRCREELALLRKKFGHTSALDIDASKQD